MFSGAAIVLILPGQETLLGSVYSFGALLSFTIAHASVARLRAKRPDIERPYRGPGNVRIGGYDAPLFALVGGSFTAIAFVVIVVLNLRVAAIGTGWLLVGMRRLRRVPPPPGPRPHLDAQGRDRAAGRRPRGGVRLGAGARRRRRPRRAADRHRDQARRPQAPRHPRARDDHRAQRAADRRADARGRGGGRLDHRAGQAAGRRARVRALGEGPRRPGRPADHRGGAGHARRGGRDDAAASASPARRCSARRSRRCWPSGRAG